MQELGFRNATVVAALPTATTALAGVIVRLDSDDKPYWCDGTQWIDLTATGSSTGLTVGMGYALARGFATP